MTVALLLGLLGLFDGSLAGVRAALGRDGRIDKRVYVRRALVRALGWSAVLIATVVAIAAAAVLTAADPWATWRELVEAGRACVWVFAPFAAVTASALGLLLTAGRDGRLLASMLVFGPLAMLRPVVIVGGLAFGASRCADPRGWLIALLAGVGLLSFERCLGRAHADDWRRLHESPARSQDR